MKTQLIKLQDKFILVSDEEIKDKEPFIDMRDYPYNISDYDIYWAGSGGTTEFANIIGKKIIAGIPELPSIDFSILSEADCKTIGWVDVDKHIKSIIGDEYFAAINKSGSQYALLVKTFKAAQALNDKMFSLEDMYMLSAKIVDDIAKNRSNTDWNMFTTPKMIADEFIQSLQQTSWDVEIEMETINQDYRFDVGQITRLKITDNSIKVLKIK